MSVEPGIPNGDKAAEQRPKTGVDRRTLLTVAAATAALAAPAIASAQQQERPPKRTTSLTNSSGFSPQRLGRLHEAMMRHVESGLVPGLVALVSRRGETHVDAIGTLAYGSVEPMQRDTIFRIASLTKPITAAAAMILVEESKLRLDDPVDPFLPELADRLVLNHIESPLHDTTPANRPITLRDLLTFRAGYGAVMTFPEQYPIQKAMSERGVSPSALLPSVPADELMRRYGELPLLHQPGEKWAYNSGADILGVLIARASGKPLGAFLRERIFDPLGMKDTGFSVPAEKVNRLPAAYQRDFATGRSYTFEPAQGGRFAAPAVFESGAGGLVSTADDYLAFARMLLNGGVHESERLLSRLSVELMTTDQITPEQKAASLFYPGFWDDRGWGFGLSIITRRTAIANVPGRYGWDGGYGTSAYTDPSEGLIGVLMTQRLWESPREPAVVTDFWTATYQGIDD